MSAAPRRHVAPLIALCALFLALTIPMTLLGRLGTSEAGDQQRYHWPTVLAMSASWPTVSLEEYRTATGPLYHAVLAAVVSIIGETQWPIRVLNVLLSLPIVVLVYRLAARRAPPWFAALLVMPIVISPYVLSSAIWITTDNVAHWLVIAALLLATTPRESMAHSRTRTFTTAIAAACATAVRQIHIWVIAPCALARLFPDDRESRTALRRNVVPAMLVALPAILVVALLVWWWAGLTPPFVEARHAAVGNPFGFGFALSLLGAFGAFYIPLTDPWNTLKRCRLRPMVVLYVLAVLLTVLTPTTLDKAEGRWGGAIWAVVDALPAIADRSIVFPPLAMMGAMFLFVACQRAAQVGRGREAMIVLVALACFTVAHAVQPWCAQRYFEPMLLVFTIWLATLGMAPGGGEAAQTEPASRRSVEARFAPILLVLIQAIIAFYAVYWQTRPADV